MSTPPARTLLDHWHGLENLHPRGSNPGGACKSLRVTPVSEGQRSSSGSPRCRSNDTCAPSKVISEGARFDGTVTQTAISTLLGTAYREDENLRARLETWGVERFGPDAFGGADRQKWRFVSFCSLTRVLGRPCCDWRNGLASRVVETVLGAFELQSTPLDSVLTRMFPAATAVDAKQGGTQDR